MPDRTDLQLERQAKRVSTVLELSRDHRHNGNCRASRIEAHGVFLGKSAITLPSRAWARIRSRLSSLARHPVRFSPTRTLALGPDSHTAPDEAAKFLRPGDRGGHRAPGADPGRHGAPNLRRREGLEPVSYPKMPCAGCWSAWACQSSGSGRCSSRCAGQTSTRAAKTAPWSGARAKCLRCAHTGSCRC